MRDDFFVQQGSHVSWLKHVKRDSSRIDQSTSRRSLTQAMSVSMTRSSHKVSMTTRLLTRQTVLPAVWGICSSFVQPSAPSNLPARGVLLKAQAACKHLAESGSSTLAACSRRPPRSPRFARLARRPGNEPGPHIEMRFSHKVFRDLLASPGNKS